MALTSVTLDGGTLRGKALARSGAISISAQETVDGPQCVTTGAADSDDMASSEN